MMGAKLALFALGGVPSVQAEVERARRREELVTRARLLGVKQPEIYSSHDLEAEVALQLVVKRPPTGSISEMQRQLELAERELFKAKDAIFGGARGGGKTRSLTERKARRAKRKQRRNR